MDEHGGIFQFLTAADLGRLGRMSLGSRFTADGAAAGGHRSRRKGVSIEFADYRPYVPGDDPKHLDWRAFGRNERLYLRQYEEETTLRVHIFVDSSASMGYSSGKVTKYQFSARLACALAYLTVMHQDSVSLALFDKETRAFLPPKSGSEHLRAIAEILAGCKPSAETSLGKCLHTLAEQTSRRGLVILLSDFFEDQETIRAALAHFRKKRHDVILYQVLDRAEVDFPFRDATAFLDPETGRKLNANPKDIRTDYQVAFGKFLEQCRETCAVLGIDHQLVLTDQDPVDFLLRHLRSRA